MSSRTPTYEQSCFARAEKRVKGSAHKWKATCRLVEAKIPATRACQCRTRVSALGIQVVFCAIRAFGLPSRRPTNTKIDILIETMRLVCEVSAETRLCLFNLGKDSVRPFPASAAAVADPSEDPAQIAGRQPPDDRTVSPTCAIPSNEAQCDPAISWPSSTHSALMFRFCS